MGFAGSPVLAQSRAHGVAAKREAPAGTHGSCRSAKRNNDAGAGVCSNMETRDETQETTEGVARRGIWTPWAQVLCAPCHAADSTSPVQVDRAVLVLRPDGQRMATCDQCQARCWVRDDVALLQRLGRRISALGPAWAAAWRLEQTGGMCAALVVTSGTRDVVAVAQDDQYDVGEYEVDPGGETYWDESLRSWSSSSFYEDGDPVDEATLGAAVTACAREMVRWAQEAPHASTSG